jgi:hypothetical protein
MSSRPRLHRRMVRPRSFVSLPSTSRRNGVGTEQNFGDLAVRAAFKPAVEAAEHQSDVLSISTRCLISALFCDQGNISFSNT